MPRPIQLTNDTPDDNVHLCRWNQRGGTSKGRRQQEAEVGLAIANALGSRPMPQTKFMAAYALERRGRRRHHQRKLRSDGPSGVAHVEHAAGGANGRTLAVVERHNPDESGFDPECPLHVHALSILKERKHGWNTGNACFWDFEGNHPNIAPKDLWEGPGGCSTRTAFHYLWKTVGEHGEAVEDLMAGELTEESLEGILVKGKGGKRSCMQVDLEHGEEIVSAPTKEEYLVRYKQLRLLEMTKAWNSVHAYAKYTYKEDTGLLRAIPVQLEAPEERTHVDQADAWFAREVPRKAPGMRHRILVIEGVTGMGKTAYTRSKGTHSRMCNVWNVASLSEDAEVWILDDMVHTNGKYSLKALSQYEADFTGRYKHVKAMKVWPSVILGNSREAITKCWLDIEGAEGEAWVAKNMEWVYAGDRPFFVFP